MGSRIREFVGHLKDLGDRTAQLTLLSISIVVILIAAVVALPGSDDDVADGAAPGTATERATKLAEKGLDISGESGPLSGAAGAPSSRSSGRVDAVEASAPASLPPITDTTIKVGFTYVEDPGTANAAAGFGGIGQIDQKRGWEAMIREVNRNPPFGRKIAPVWFSQTTDEITSKGQERVEQEACAHFTQDNKVFMVWDGFLVGQETFQACATKAKVPEIGGGGGLSYSQTYRDYPYVVDPFSAALDRMAAFQVDQLHAHGFFSKFKDNALPYTPQKPADGKPRIGLIRYDQPSYKAGAKTMKARLAAHGLSLCAGCEFEVSYSSDNPQEQLDDATEVNSAIQSCKSKGCTHMLFLGSTAGVRITLFFVDGAEKQQYRPRLGLNPLDAPTAVRDFLGASSYPQFRQSILITDGPNEFDVKTPAFKRCKKIFEEAGETFSGDEAANKEGQIPFWCDTTWYFQAAMQATGRTLSLESWLNGVATHAPVESASNYLMQTKADRHDGSGAIRVGEWFDDCSCFKPTSGVIPV